MSQNAATAKNATETDSPFRQTETTRETKPETPALQNPERTENVVVDADETASPGTQSLTVPSHSNLRPMKTIATRIRYGHHLRT